MEIFKWNYFFGVTVFVFLFGGGIQQTGACQPQENRTDATAHAFYQNEAQVVTSCHGFSSDTIEVHVVGIYESVASDSDGEEILTSLVDIRGETNKSVVLILFSRGHVTWLVDAANAINLRVAIQITNSTFSAVDLSRIYNNEHINVRTRSIPYGADSLDDASDLIRTISAEFGFVTSFAGTVRADRWLLTLDGHGRNSSKTTIGAKGRVQECLQEADCWLRYNFTYDDNWTACRGAQYVKHTPFDVGKYLGVVLCSETRYKLFMGDDLEEKFLNMADGSGSGQDYCILIGGDEASARLAGNGFDSPSATGYYRSFAGETPRIGPIGFGPKDLSAWTGRYYPTWYECGVSIPGNSTVVSVSADAWDDVTFGQAKFTTDRTFIVPAGVIRVDVICIGGGGGGRDDQAEFMEGEDGGNSTFGAYLGAQGGMGGKLNNAGGEGGYGTVANGGQAGAGGGCSAGGGAAGQTSGGGHGGLEAGSSFHPFCGAGGSSGGSSCGQEFANIAQGTSGPGGTAAANREPGLYGGGGGSRAGGRAGGGGGYSRATVNVTPGERIIIRVGAAANEGRWVGTSAPGVVVVSWGGPINATGPFVNIGTVSEVAPPTTTPPLLSTTPIITLPRTQCGFSYHCSGSYRMRAVCINGYCQCRGSGYNQYTCLPEVGSCRILANQDSALATTTAGLEVHSCVGDSSNSSHEVHVLGIYENSGSRGRVFPTTVRIEGSTSKPMVLVVSNYEPVRWVIRAQPEVDLRKVLLFSYHHTGSTVAIHGGRNPSAVRVVKARSPSGRGNDAGGGRTAELLALLTENYGSVASFTGTYRTSSWVLRLPASSSTSVSPATAEPSTASTTPNSSTAANANSVQACLRSSDCWVQYNFTYDGNFTACTGAQYVRQTRYMVGRYIGAVLCTSTRFKLVMADDLEDVFLNVGDGSGAGEDLCDLIGGSKDAANLPSDFWNSPSAYGFRITDSGFQKGMIGYGPPWTGHYFPTWYECRGVSIPGNSQVIPLSIEGATTTTSGTTAVQSTASTRRNSSTEANTASPIVLTTIVLTTAAVTTIPPTTAVPTTASTTPKSSPSAITHSVRACLRSSNCWVQYNFTYDRNFTACTGAQYVTQTRYSVGRYIGAVLCTSTRFKLVMADDLGDVFLNVGDGSGAGEDLCDLIGGSKDEANLPLDFWDSPSAYGYRIVASGFVKGLIGYGPPWTGQYYPTWYECRGVAIPGNSQVIPLSIEGATTVTSARTTTPTVESSTTQAAIDWGNATFGQLKFEADGVFVVPAGVRLVDVICIGGGGGGRDGHSAFTRSPGYGGDGGNSSFGEYVWAEGGKGALRNDSGGGGGRGMTRDGGQGGVGGGCSAGAGAAGQTSGGGGGLIGGSSSLPFCGGGGSSGGSSCGTEFGDIGPATSGPGGRDPENRAGGLYGGGGGSRAGGRAGGGGGYSRATISVTPGQMVNVTVGRAGTPHYRRPGPGLVVVSWGGPINPLFGG